MPGDDLLIGDDGDYVDDGEGAFELTLTAQPAVRHQLLDRLGEWVGDPEAGRERRGIGGRNNSEAEADDERDSLLKALQKLEAEALIADSKIEVDRDPRGRLGFRMTSVDVQAGGTITIDTLEEFGG